MVVYHSGSNTCEAYEIKHSKEIAERQYHVLDDEALCADVERKYGKISVKCILYRDDNALLPNGIQYENVETFLKKL